MKPIYPRSPREVMSGWTYLPRLVDKIRLKKAERLGVDYQDNYLTRGFDALWFESAGVDPQLFVQIVENSITDGEVADWVSKNVKKTEAEKATHRKKVLTHGSEGAEVRARLIQRKEQAGLSERIDIETFVDFIDADEGRS